MRIAGLVNGVVLLLGLSVWLGWCVVSALRSGMAEVVGGRDYRRSQRPWMYGVVVSIQSFLALVFFAAALWCFGKLLGLRAG